MIQLTTNHSNVVEWMPNLHYPGYKDTALKPNIAFKQTHTTSISRRVDKSYFAIE